MVTNMTPSLIAMTISKAQNLIEISKYNGRKKHRKEDDHKFGYRVDFFKGTGQERLSDSEAEKACSDVLWRGLTEDFLKGKAVYFAVT